MKDKVFTFVVVGLIIFFVVTDTFPNLITNPLAVLKGLAIMSVAVAVIYFPVLCFYKLSPERREQRSFIKAAKRATKQVKSSQTTVKPEQKQSSVSPLKKMKIRKKSDVNPYLTVIEGRKGKKEDHSLF